MACEVCNVDLSPKEMKPLVECLRDDLVAVAAGVDVVRPLLAQWYQLRVLAPVSKGTA